MLLVYFVNYSIALSGDNQWLHTYGWRWMFASEFSAGNFVFHPFIVCPETPRYLVMRGNNEKAKSVLEKFLGDAAAGKELEAIRESFKQKNAFYSSVFSIYGSMDRTFSAIVWGV
jgi:SP family xylose:H+ symportor-like MFS transporter